MKQYLVLGLFACVAFGTTSARAQYQSYGESQQFDAGFGAGTVVAPSYSTNSANHNPQSLAGGTYLSLSGDALFWHHLGVQGEVAWRASQGDYAGRQQPYRPILHDFNAIYAPPLGRHAQLELLGGLGGISTHFYTPFYYCNFYSCQNYFSSSHFMGDVGIAIRFYLWHGVFLRPEFRQYFITNNVEYSSPSCEPRGSDAGVFVWTLENWPRSVAARSSRLMAHSSRQTARSSQHYCAETDRALALLCECGHGPSTHPNCSHVLRAIV